MIIVLGVAMACFSRTHRRREHDGQADILSEYLGDAFRGGNGSASSASSRRVSSAISNGSCICCRSMKSDLFLAMSAPGDAAVRALSNGLCTAEISAVPGVVAMRGDSGRGRMGPHGCDFSTDRTR